jgi:hypothetical protein
MELSKAVIKFQALKKDEKARAILRIQISPILKANPKLSPTQAKHIFDRAQEIAKHNVSK